MAKAPDTLGALRWARICQDCWYLINPGQYCPQLTNTTACDGCGQECVLTCGVVPEVAEKAKEASR